MTAHQAACASVIAVLVASPQVVRAQAGWPTAAAATTIDSKPKAARTPVTVTKKPAGPETKAGATPVRESQSMRQPLTELLTRQTVAIDALLRRLDPGEAAIAGANVAPAVTPVVDPAYAAPMPPVSVSMAAVNVPRRSTFKGRSSLFPVLTVTGQYTHALDSDYVIADKERFDVVFTDDVVKALAPARR